MPKPSHWQVWRPFCTSPRANCQHFFLDLNLRKQLKYKNNPHFNMKSCHAIQFLVDAGLIAKAITPASVATFLHITQGKLPTTTALFCRISNYASGSCAKQHAFSIKKHCMEFSFWWMQARLLNQSHRHILLLESSSTHRQPPPHCPPPCCHPHIVDLLNSLPSSTMSTSLPLSTSLPPSTSLKPVDCFYLFLAAAVSSLNH